MRQQQRESFFDIMNDLDPRMKLVLVVVFTTSSYLSQNTWALVWNYILIVLLYIARGLWKSARNVATLFACFIIFDVMQNSDCQLFSESVENELYLDSDTNEEQRERGWALLDKMGLTEYLHHHPASLSGGQKQRLCIAVACMKNPDVICFDEPTSGLDYESMLRVSSLLNELSSEGKVLLVTSHDYEFLMSACSHICHLEEGEVADYYTVSESTAEKTYSLLFPEKKPV